ncbi:MAG: AbiV family abortive infection protein [Candidatus Thorarchaeota archaeon]
MNLNIWRKGFDLCVKNAMELARSGELMLKEENLAHAYFFYFTALEELGAAGFIAFRINEPVPEKLKKFLNHRKKVALSFIQTFNLKFLIPDDLDEEEYLDILREGVNKKDILASEKFVQSKMYKRAEKLLRKKDLIELRHRSLYIGLKKDSSDFLSPKLITRDDVDSIKSLFTDRMEFIDKYRELVKIYIKQLDNRAKKTLFASMEYFPNLEEGLLEYYSYMNSPSGTNVDKSKILNKFPLSFRDFVSKALDYHDIKIEDVGIEESERTKKELDEYDLQQMLEDYIDSQFPDELSRNYVKKIFSLFPPLKDEEK